MHAIHGDAFCSPIYTARCFADSDRGVTHLVSFVLLEHAIELTADRGRLEIISKDAKTRPATATPEAAAQRHGVFDIDLRDLHTAYLARISRPIGD